MLLEFRRVLFRSGEQSKWVGKCPDCGAWNTMEETIDVPQGPAQQRRQTLLGTSSIAQGTQIPLVLPAIKPLVQQRISVGYPEMDRVLGGGLVAGSLRSEEHTSELQSHHDLVCRLLL